MLNVRIKIILVFLILLSLFLSNTHYTDADIFAERVVQQNRFSVTTVDFSARHSANNGSISYIFRTIGLQPGGFDLGAVKIKKEGELNFKYHIKIVKISGDDNFCNALNVQVLQRNLTPKYEGKLMNLSINSDINDSAPQDWIVFIGLDDTGGALKNKICEFDLIFKTWRNQPDENKGIYAERILNNVISSGNW